MPFKRASGAGLCAVALCLLASATFPLLSSSTEVQRGVFVFHSGDGNDAILDQYDWSVINVICTFGEPDDTDKYGDVIGKAHSNGALVVKGVGIDDEQVLNATYRSNWVQQTLQDALDHGYDGVNIDKEGGFKSTDSAEAYVELVQDTVAAFRGAMERSHISVDLPAYPGYEHWLYDELGLSKAADALFIMGYDDFQWDDYSCATRHDCSPANAPYKTLANGIEGYLALGIEPSKLILGLPWYGKAYSRVAGVPFNMGSVGLNKILPMVDQNLARGGEVQWDEVTYTWRLTCTVPCDDNDTHKLPSTEIWFDDATSLTPKLQLAVDYGLGGVGMWTATDLDYTGTYPNQTQAVWNAYAHAATTPAPGAGSPRPMAVYRSRQDEDGDDSGSATDSQGSEMPGTTPDRERLSRRENVQWTQEAAEGEVDARITVDLTAELQTLQGFGGAVTDSMAYVFSQLGPRNQAEVLDYLWGDNGNRLTLLRVPIGASDFATSVYSYDEVVGDFNLSHFSTSHDDEAILPLIRGARKAAAKGGRDVRVLATPWSAPSWLKRNKYVRDSLMPGLIQDDDTFSTYADYIAAFITSYEAADVPIWAVTVQNEPHVAKQVVATYPSMGYEGSHEGAFLGSYLGPRLKEAFPDIQIFIHDDQKMKKAGDTFMVDRVDEILAQPGAREVADGVAFHWYGANLNNYDALQQLHEKYPDLNLLATEATLKWPSARKWNEGLKYAVDILHDLRNFATGWIEWNLLLAFDGGPTCIGPMTRTKCDWVANHSVGHCEAPLRADLSNTRGHLHVGDQYYFMGHFSRFLPPGSRVVQSTSDQGPTTPQSDLQYVAALTPDDELVVVALNNGDSDLVMELGVVASTGVSDYVARPTLPKHSISTFVVPQASAM